MITTTGQWKPGTSGNPNGRPKGSGEVARMRAAITDRIPEILDAMTKKAVEGDVSAARLLLERAIPPLRAQEQPIGFQLPQGSFTDQGRGVLQAVSQEEIDPSRGSALMASIAQLAKVTEIDELTRRMAAIEERMKCQVSQPA